MRFRLNGESKKEGPEVLFNTGIGVGRIMGSRVNNYSLAIMDGNALTFVVQSQRNTSVEVVSSVKIEPDRWHDAVIRWGGFNRPGDNPLLRLRWMGTETGATTVRFLVNWEWILRICSRVRNRGRFTSNRIRHWRLGAQCRCLERG